MNKGHNSTLVVKIGGNILMVSLPLKSLPVFKRPALRGRFTDRAHGTCDGGGVAKCLLSVELCEDASMTGVRDPVVGAVPQFFLSYYG